MEASTSMTTISNRYWAIRMGDYVELRVSAARPLAIHSKRTRILLVPRCYAKYNPKDGVVIVNDSYKVKRVLRQTYYVGGRILGVVGLSRFRTYHVGTLAPWGIVEIPREIRVKVLKQRHT